MNLTNIQNIGTTFKKENIFLATILYKKGCENTKFEEMIKQQGNSEIIPLLSEVVISETEADIFYKDEKGYTRFCGEEGPETFVGDDSDGNGLIRNVVSVWDYYLEDELKEALLNDTFNIIVATTIEPLKNYNEDYNG